MRKRQVYETFKVRRVAFIKGGRSLLRETHLICRPLSGVRKVPTGSLWEIFEVKSGWVRNVSKNCTSGVSFFS